MKTSTTLIALSLVLSLSACRKHVSEAPSVVDLPAAAPKPTTKEEAHAELKRNFERVHFAYDSASLDSLSQAALAQNADILAQFPALRVEVQGHCDERGTTDYNLALGQKRASAVVSYLKARGVAPSRVAAVSYGEERPVASGEGESIWSQNRRAEFRVLSDAPAGITGSTF